MKNIIHIEFSQTVNDFIQEKQEYQGTKLGKKVKTIGIIVFIVSFIFLISMITFFHAIFVKSTNMEVVFSLGSIHFYQTIIYYWVFLVILFSVILISIIFPKKSSYESQYNKDNRLRALKSIEVTNKYIHESSAFGEKWIMLDAITNYYETKSNIFLSGSFYQTMFIIPLRCLEDKPRKTLLKLLTQSNTIEYKYSVDKGNIIQPCPVGTFLRLKPSHSLSSKLWHSVELFLFPSLFSQIKVFTIAGAFFLIFSSLFLDLALSIGALNIILTNLLSILVPFIICILVDFFLDMIIRIRSHYRMKDTPQQGEILIDELGIFFGNGKENLGINWTDIDKIIITKHNYFFLSHNLDSPVCVSKIELDGNNNKIITNIIQSHPEIKRITHKFF
jgi:hypothetical protein